MKVEFEVCRGCGHLKFYHYHANSKVAYAKPRCFYNWPYDSWVPADDTCKCEEYQE